MKRGCAILLAACVLSMLISCSRLDENVSKDNNAGSGLESELEDTQAQKFMKEHYPGNGEGEPLNLRTPEEGEELAVITTSSGVIKIMLFPDVAPLAVENFKALIGKKYYDHTQSNLVTIHKVCENSFIQAGDPTGTGAGGQSASGEPFADEFSEKALNLRGALGMANNGAGTNTSQFYIVQAPNDTVTENVWDLLEERQQKAFPQKVMELYEKYGGMPWLDFQNTVFGQVVEGMDVVDQIAAVEVNEKDVPVTPVVIESIVLETYHVSSEAAE